MKIIKFIPYVIILFTTIISFGCSKKKSDEHSKTFIFNITNTSALARNNEVIQFPLSKIKAKYSAFNENNFYITDGKNEIPSQLEDVNADGKPDNLLFLDSFSPNQTKQLTVHYNIKGVKKHSYTKLTQAVLGEKQDYKLKKSYYTGGKFVDVVSATVPKTHFAHDALYRIEGPGWESNLITYRYYLDSRNRNDIFGKKINGLVLQKLGVNDLVSNSKESYTKMLDWGMDIFKVGESMGIGSIAMWKNSKAVFVSVVDTTKCYIADNGSIRSDVYTKYFGWKVGKQKYNLFSNLSISADSRLTKVDLKIEGNSAELCTGLAKHPHTKLIKFSSDSKSEWSYLALYGKQSLAGDNLGIAVFYRKSDLIKTTQNNTSYIIILRPTDGYLTYYFGAAWSEEPNGIKTQSQYVKYLNDVIQKLNKPIEVNL